MASGNVTVNVLGTREFKTAIALLREFVAQGNQQYVPDEDMESLMAEAETFLEHGVTLTQPQPDAGLREAAQAVVDDWFGTYDPEVRIPSAAENIEALRAALRSTPAAPRPPVCPECKAELGCDSCGYSPVNDLAARNDAEWTAAYEKWDAPTQSAPPPAPSGYLPMACPVCGRDRVMWDGKVLSCEKCTTSSEWDGFTEDRYLLRSTPAAPAHLPVTSTPSSEDRGPCPECGGIHWHTPAAPQPDAGSRTECSLAGVHAHSFQGPHTFHEWEPGTTPAPRDTVTVEPLRPVIAKALDVQRRARRVAISSEDWRYTNGYNDCLAAVLAVLDPGDSLRWVRDPEAEAERMARALGESPNPTSEDAP